MTIHVASLLIHDEDVPAPARAALKEAYANGAPSQTMLESAAHVLFRETDLDCRDVRELVGLPEDGGCA